MHARAAPARGVVVGGGAAVGAMRASKSGSKNSGNERRSRLNKRERRILTRTDAGEDARVAH
jgi:hypothetical protein